MPDASIRSLVACAVAAVASLATAAGAQAQQPWGFEQVTPAVKGGGAVHAIKAFQPSDDGGRFLYSTTAPLEDVPAEGAPAYVRYVATRGALSWVSRSLEPPFQLPPGSGTSYFYFQSVVATSPNLRYAMVASKEALTPGATPGGGNLYIREAETGELTLVATGPDSLVTSLTGSTDEITGLVLYVADDGREALFLAAATLGLVPGGPASGTALYSWTSDEGLKLESVLPDGTPTGTAGSTNGRIGFPRSASPRHDALRRIYFKSAVAPGATYVREAGSTRLVSSSRVTGAPPETAVSATPIAATSEGRHALIQADGPLTDDTPSGITSRILYRFDASTDDLEYVGAMNASNDVLVQMSDDGRTIAFQSGRALLPAATVGRKNLYVWRDGVLRLVATADPGSTATNNDIFLRVLSRNGRYLAFTDSSLSVAQSFGFDNRSVACGSGGAVGPCEQVYRYDVDGDELACVSCRTDSAPPAGGSGDPGFAAPGKLLLNGHQAQTVADDGTVFFTSEDDLLPADRNAANDVYAWSNGSLRLISRARFAVPSRFLDATPDGETVFIATNDRIAATDVDDAVDVYATGEGAGFPVVDGETPGCRGAGCRRLDGPAPALPWLGSLGFSGRDNVRPGAAVSVRLAKRKVVAGAVARVRVRLSGAGRLSVVGRSVKRWTRSAPEAGRYTVRIALKPRARRALRKRKALRVPVRVLYRARGGRSVGRRTVVIFRVSKERGSMGRGRAR